MTDPSPSDIFIEAVSIDAPAIEVARVHHRFSWCFNCLEVKSHSQVLLSTVRPTYWGPKIAVVCDDCGTVDGDIFPGKERSYL